MDGPGDYHTKEVNQTKRKPCTYMWNLRKNSRNESIYKTETDSNMENQLMATKRERARGINWECGMSRYPLPSVQ